MRLHYLPYKYGTDTNANTNTTTTNIENLFLIITLIFYFILEVHKVIL